MRKKFRTKKRIKIKRMLYILLIIVVIYLVNFCIKRINLINSNTIFINSVLDSSNNYSYDENKNENIVDVVLNYISNNIFNSPTSLLKTELKYEEENKVKKVEFIYEENELPRIYIYNSHQGENYDYKYLEEYNIVPNVLMASQMLEEKLENLGISTIVEENDILEYMEQNNLNHGGSYIASRYFLEKTINKYPSMDLYIDLHRDAATHSVTYTNINGKDCAKILFVIGLEYDTYQENLKVVTELNNLILNKYPSLTRGIMKKEGYGVNGVYNQDLDSNVILIEIGGHENNIDEVNNTLDLIAEIIGEYLNEKENKK
ncbi:MAG: stage II sporulation protein P [Bacilli bacterium]|nr:stage II sporulation protein P [Bacilli bacterium]